MSTGIEAAARIALITVRASIRELTTIEEVVFCCFASADLAVYARLLEERGA